MLLGVPPVPSYASFIEISELAPNQLNSVLTKSTYTPNSSMCQQYGTARQVKYLKDWNIAEAKCLMGPREIPQQVKLDQHGLLPGLAHTRDATRR